MGGGVGCRCGLDPTLLWLWLAAAAQIQPLAWELPHAAGLALKSKTKQNNLFNVWLNIQSDEMSHGHWKNSPYTHQRKRIKTSNKVLVLL